MNYKLNSKGQGALEYLLIIGGVVLVTVVVVALLIGMSSENTENSKQQSKEFIASTDLALPSTVLSVICKEKAGADEYVVKWNPTHKEGYEYTVLFDDKPIIFNNTNPNFDLTPSDNPVVFIYTDYNTNPPNPTNPIVAECSSLGSEAISIKTTNTENDTTAVSNRVFIKPQAAGTSTPPAVPSIAFNVAAGTTVLSNHGLPEVPVNDFYAIRIYDANPTVAVYTSERIGPGTLLNNLPIDTVGGGFWQGRLKDVGGIKALYNASKITTVRIYQRATDTEILTIPVANVTVS